MTDRFKTRLRNFLRWQVAVGSRSEEILAAVGSVSSDLHKIQTRSDLAARLNEAAIEDAVATAGAAQREVAYHRALIETDLKKIAAHLAAIEQRIETLHPASGTEPEPRPKPPFAYLGNHLGLATVETGFRIFIDTRDRQIAPHLATVGIWEPWTTTLLQAILKPGDSIVEVGANFGFFTLLMAYLVGAAGRIASFEANPALVALLTDSLRINGVSDRVDLRNFAVTDSPGETEFSVYRNFAGDGHVAALDAGRHPDQDRLRVPSDTLDNLIPGDAEIRLLRLDAEGSEPAILRGARSLIERSPRLAILMEWGFGTEGRTDELQYLDSLGFRFHIVANDGFPHRTTPEALSESRLCDVLCYRGDVTEFLSRPTQDH
ncbi:MAG TPA: FkbM family methyltransferase [Acidiphilium sp.]